MEGWRQGAPRQPRFASTGRTVAWMDRLRFAKGVGQGISTVASEALPCDFNTGGCLPPLVLRRVEHALHARDDVAWEATCGDLVNTLLVFHQAVEDRVEGLVRGEGVLIGLVGTQFRGGRLGER